MTIGRFGKHRDKPFYWWGTPDRRQPIPTIDDLIEQGSIARIDAAALILLIDRGLPLFVVSETSGAGKSTLLAALVNAASMPKERIYLRGNYESFGFLADAEPARSLLLVNEISPHLPAYLWGPGVSKVMECLRTGYQVFGTAHAANGPALVQLLTSAPLRVPVDLAVQAYAVVTLADRPAHQDPLLRVTSIGGILPGSEPGAFQFLELTAGDRGVPPIAQLERMLVAARADPDGVSITFDELENIVGEGGERQES